MDHYAVQRGRGFESGYVDESRSTLPGSGRHRKAANVSRRGAARRKAAGTVVAAILVATGAGVSIAWITATHPRGAESVATTAAVDTDVTEWIRSNLPEGARLLSDGAPVPSDYPSAALGQPDQDWHAFDFLLTRPGDPPLDTTAAAVWRSSIPVAIFPAVQIRHIVQTVPEGGLRTREADRADRLVAGTALLANPRIDASPQAKAVLTAGGLDLRAAATLTALAAAVDVDVADVEDVKAEAAAGMPARTMTFRVTDNAKANTVISGMTAAFRPDQVIATPDGSFRLHWPLNLNPLPSVN